jgi:PAS domain S-box-containing protein
VNRLGGKEEGYLPKRPTILLIDNDEDDRALAAMVISKDFPDCRVLEIEDAAGFARSLARERLDLVVTEQDLDWSDGMSVLETVRDSRPEVPVVMLTGSRDAELAVAGMKAGLSDYVIKSSKSYVRLAGVLAESLEKAATEQLVARSEPWLQTLLDRAGVGVFRSTPDQRMIEANPALLRLLGVKSVVEALEVDLPIHSFRSDNSTDLPTKVSQRGELQARAIEVARPDGSKVWLNLTEVLLLDVDGDIVVDGLVQDISHLREHESDTAQRLEELERANADLTEFASVAGHELREPLRMVEKHADLLKEDTEGKLGVEAVKSLGFVRDGAKRLSSLLDDLLSFTRITGGWQTFAPCDCNSIVDETILQFEDTISSSKAEIRRERLPTVLADPTQLPQVFQNLIGNALKFRSKESPKIRVSVLRGDNEWVFSIKDNGVGIEADDLDDVFTIFRRLHPEYTGTGIGLAICRRVVERHGGRIWVESAPGKGSTFSFTIPFLTEQSEERPGLPAPESTQETSG